MLTKSKIIKYESIPMSSTISSSVSVPSSSASTESLTSSSSSSGLETIIEEEEPEDGSVLKASSSATKDPMILQQQPPPQQKQYPKTYLIPGYHNIKLLRSKSKYFESLLSGAKFCNEGQLLHQERRQQQQKQQLSATTVQITIQVPPFVALYFQTFINFMLFHDVDYATDYVDGKKVKKKSFRFKLLDITEGDEVDDWIITPTKLLPVAHGAKQYLMMDGMYEWILEHYFQGRLFQRLDDIHRDIQLFVQIQQFEDDGSLDENKYEILENVWWYASKCHQRRNGYPHCHILDDLAVEERPRFFELLLDHIDERHYHRHLPLTDPQRRGTWQVVRTLLNEIEDDGLITKSIFDRLLLKPKTSVVECIIESLKPWEFGRVVYLFVKLYVANVDVDGGRDQEDPSVLSSSLLSPKNLERMLVNRIVQRLDYSTRSRLIVSFPENDATIKDIMELVLLPPSERLPSKATDEHQQKPNLMVLTKEFQFWSVGHMGYCDY
mmetsp:Transcript_8351/g.20849  ORF Transcript_8351/g.20849 Transcript_8351/m.20849 type:complete len:495 (+) Transcript_8351:302-1786(+)